jgi:integrase
MIRKVFADHLDRPALDLRPSDLQRAVDAYPAPVSAARAVGYVRPVMSWAAKRDLVVKGFNELEKPAEERRQRVLSRDELKAILPHLTDEYGRAALFLLLTAARLREATEATWAEFDLSAGTWTIPASRRKDTRARAARNGSKAQGMIVPLSRQALQLLQEVGPGAPDQLVFRGERGGRLVNWDRWLKRVFVASGTNDWSAHALRRTAATLAGELGTPPHVVEVMLGHRNIGGQLHAGYNQSRYLQDHAEALERLSRTVSLV